MDKYVIGALNMLVTSDPANPNAFNAYRELARFAQQKENLSAAARHLINAVHLCPDPAMKQKLHQEARMISAAVNLYNRPESELEQAGKLIQEASIAPQNAANPLLVQASQILSSNFIEKYQTQKKLTNPINPAFASTYQSSFDPIPSTIQADDLTVLEMWFKILKLARKFGCWRLLRVAGRHIVYFREVATETDEIDEESVTTLQPDSVIVEKKVSRQNTPTGKKGEKSKKEEERATPQKSVMVVPEVPKISSREKTVGRIACQSMLLEAEGWIQLLRKQTGSDLFIHGLISWSEEEVANIEIMISKFVVSLMKDCLDLANSLELDYLVHNSSVYLWNYAQKLLITSNFEYIPLMFREAFEILSNGKTELAPDLVIHMATALANSPLIEKDEPLSSETSISGRGSANSRSSNRSQKTQTTPKKASKNSSKSRLSAEEHQRRENLVAAIEICERAIEATRNHKLKAQSLIDLARNWLRLRLELGRLNNEVIQPNNLKIGASAIKNELPLVFVWLSLDLYYFGHSSGGVSLVELAEIIDKIDEKTVGLTEHTPLVISAHRYLAVICLNSTTELIPLARSCCESALKLFNSLDNSLKVKCSREVAFCHLLLGQVIRNENGDLKDIQKEFVLSAELSDELALSATTKWWNASIKLTNDELGRKMLAKQAKQLINAIAKRPRAKGCQEIRARLYSIVAKKLLDEKNYAGALRELDQALQSMPKIPERLPLILQRIECKAHLEMDASLDIQRVGAESPEYLATGWRHFAEKQKNLKKEDKAMISLQQAIENAPDGELKSELLLEYANLLTKNNRHLEAFECLNKIELGAEAVIRSTNKILQLSRFKVVAQRLKSAPNFIEDRLAKSKEEVQWLLNSRQVPVEKPSPAGKPPSGKSKKETSQPVLSQSIAQIDEISVSNARDFCSALYHIATRFKDSGHLNSANECATLISLVAEKCQEYSWKTIGLLTSLQISIQNKSNSRVDLEKKIAQRVPLPINEAVELQIPVNGWIISAQLMLKLGFLDSAQAICDGGLCICSVQPQYIRDGSMSQFYQIRGATMLRLYESKQRMNDAIYCLEKAMENSQHVPCSFWPDQTEYLVSAIMRSNVTCREAKAESIFDQMRCKLREREQCAEIEIQEQLAEIAFHQVLFLSGQGTVFHRIDEVFQNLEFVQSVFTGEKYGYVILEHGKIFIQKIHLVVSMSATARDNKGNLTKEDKTDIISMYQRLSRSISILQSSDTRNSIIGELQLMLSLLLATIATYVYKCKKKKQREFNELSEVEKKIEHYVAEYTDVTGWEKEWALLEESASQAASALLSTLARDDRFDAKTRARALLYMGRLPNELDTEELNPWQDDLYNIVNTEKFTFTRKNSIWKPYDENLTPRQGNDFFVDVDDSDATLYTNSDESISLDRQSSLKVFKNRPRPNSARGVSFMPSHLSLLRPRIGEPPAFGGTGPGQRPNVVLPDSDPVAEMSYWNACALSQTLQVECTQHLLLAIKMAHDDVEILIESSITLLNLIGPNDPMFSFHTLLQLQGAQASKFFQRLLSQACNAPNTSRLSHCVRLLFSQKYSCDGTSDTLWSSINEFRSWRNSMLSTIPILGNISYPVLVLQHADGLLYAGLYNPMNKDVKIVRSRAAINELKDLQDVVQDIRQKLLSECLKREYNQVPDDAAPEEGGNDKETTKNTSRTTIDDKSRPDSVKSGESGKSGSSQSSGMEEIELDELTEQLEMYLDNIMDQLRDELDQIPDSQPMLLIADAHFLDFPIELLTAFKNRPITRDFSIQIHQERLTQAEAVEKDKKSKGPANQNNVPLGKIIALATPGKCFDMLQEKKMGWIVKSGLSIGELETLVSQSYGLLYCGRERFLAEISPSRIAALDLAQLQLAILIDRSPEPKSFIQQNKLDLDKDPVQVQAENYLNTVALLTLAGVSTIILNQWSSDQPSNDWRLNEICSGMQSNISAAEALLYIRDPTRKPQVESKAKKAPKPGKGKGNVTPTESENNLFQLSHCQAFNSVCYGLPNAYIN